jgi:hypothetical protein
MPAVSVDLSEKSLLAANVNPATMLATDYLNVFNEALMLITMVGDAPELLEELADWQPCSYEIHFRASPFHFKDVVVAAYGAADPALREAFDAQAHELSGAVEAAITELSALHDKGQPLNERALELAGELQAGVARLDAMIHGGLDHSSSQDAIDALFD